MPTNQQKATGQAQSKEEKAEAIKTAAPKFKVKKALSLPQLKPQVDIPLYIQVMGGITAKPSPDPKMPGDMHLVTVTNLVTGEAGQLILDKIPFEAFADYGENLDGVCFEFIKHPKVAGRSAGEDGSGKYSPYTINEIEVEK